MVSHPVHPVGPHPESCGDSHPFQLGLHGRSDLAVHRGEDPVDQVGDGHLHPEGGEGRGEFDTDRPGTDHEQPVGDAVHPQDLVGVADTGVVEADAGGVVGTGAGGYHHRRGLEPSRPAFGFNFDEPLAGEAPGPLDPLDPAVVDQPRRDLLEQRAHFLRPPCYPLHGDLGRRPKGDLVHLAVAEPGQVESRLAQGLGRSAARGRHSPAGRRPLDDGDTSPECRRQLCCCLAGRA